MEYPFFIDDERYILKVPSIIPIDKTTFLPAQQPLINKEHKFIYQPLCKVGCKTIKTWMLSLLKEEIVNKMGEGEFGRNMEIKHGDNSDFDIHSAAGDIFGKVGGRANLVDGQKQLKHDTSYIKVLDDHNFEFEDKVKDYFKFTFVRNPWVRLVSVYLQKFRHPDGLIYPHAINMNASMVEVAKHHGHFDILFDRDGILSFQGFIETLYQFSKTDYNNFDIHWLPQYIMNDMYLKDFDFIGKIENFENDFDKILKELNIKIKPKYNIGSNSYKFQKVYKFYENREDLIYKVSEIYKEDIERYNYSFKDLENK